MNNRRAHNMPGVQILKGSTVLLVAPRIETRDSNLVLTLHLPPCLCIYLESWDAERERRRKRILSGRDGVSRFALYVTDPILTCE